MRGELKFGMETHRSSRWNSISEAFMWVLQILIVCLIAFVCVWYFGQRVSMSGDSMNPVLSNGDIVLTNRFVYDASSPRRGDIIVFRPNGNEKVHPSMKRIIGLPGETIQIIDGEVYIDGKVLKEKYQVTGHTEAGLADKEIILQGNEFFVMGDNRESSEDSRMPDIGNVKRSEIEGEAWFIVAPKKHFGWIR